MARVAWEVGAAGALLGAGLLLVTGNLHGQVAAESGAVGGQCVAAVAAGNQVSVELPRSAAGAERVTDPRSGLSVAVRLQGALAASRARFEQGAAVYAGALAPSTELTRRTTPLGVEDFVKLSHDTGQRSLTWRVDVSQVAGLRLVGNVLELLDAGGAPRLRATAPYLADANGKHHPLALDVEGCAVDRSPAAPWGRPVTPPGASECSVRVSWNDAALAYPIVVDPAWTATGSLVYGMAEHFAIKLQSGQVLVGGGTGGISELYDPSSGTWAASGTPVANHSVPGVGMLDDGRVLVVGGGTDACEIYDPSSGAFTATGSMSTGRDCFGLAKLDDGRFMAVGGYFANYELNTAEIYDPQAGTWSNAASMAQFRDGVSATTLPNGSVLAAGGKELGKRFDTTELYYPSGDYWTAGPKMPSPHASQAALVLDNGLVAIVGGESTGAVDFFDPAKHTWRSGDPLSVTGYASAAVALPDSSVLVTGGSASGGNMATTETVTAESGRESPGANMTTIRSFHTATLLSSTATTATVLVVGGYGLAADHTGQKTAEIYTASLRGAACTTGTDCITGQCVDGVCCDSACKGICMACSAAKKGGGADGICDNVAADSDPDNDCQDQGASSCGTTGVCDGKGACTLYAAGTQCSPDACSGNSYAHTYACDGAGKCVDTPDDCAPGYCDPNTHHCVAVANGGTGGGGSGGYGGSYPGTGGYYGTGGSSGSSNSAAPKSGGCGCSTTPRRDTPGLVFLLGMAFGLGVRRRRRGARRGARSGRMRTFLAAAVAVGARDGDPRPGPFDRSVLPAP